MVSQSLESRDLFAEAVASYRSTLKDKDRAAFKAFQDPGAMLREVSMECKKHKDSSKLMKCCAKIASFSRMFEPYFEVVSIFVQVKPEYMGIIWGAIRFIFKLGENHVVFLEKIAGLFESLSLVLPQYREHYENCRRRVFDTTDHTRLVAIMSLVYADVIEFCQEVYLIFSKPGKDTKLKHSLRLFGKSVWQPFDARFAELHERMQGHRMIFDQEMRLQDQLALTEHFMEFQSLLKATENLSLQEREQKQAKEKNQAASRLLQLYQWIWNKDHRSTFEKARSSIHPGSCDWIIEKPQYQQWRDNVRRVENASEASSLKWTSRFISIQAKPGFGKSALSVAIIEDLFDIRTSAPLSHSTLHCVAFYHFNAGDRRASNTAADAFRSIAAQLINSHRNDNSTIDTLSILFKDTSGGQQQASLDSIHAVLKILMQNCPAYLVIDGIDECSDYPYFLANLNVLLEAGDCRVLVLSRPNLEFPSTFRSTADSSWEMLLSSEDNSKAMTLFLTERLRDCEAEGLFGDAKVTDNFVEDLVCRASGMFLWATLLLNYLRSSFLSPLERLETLEEGSLLEGLGALYRKILLVLERSSEKHKQSASDIMKWVAASTYPLSPEELRFALAIIPGQQTHDMQLLIDFPRCVPRITCALVDVNENGSISFIHTSLQEFLEDDLSCNPFFSLRSKLSIHRRLTSVALSYLVYDVPMTPLNDIFREADKPRGDTIRRFGTHSEVCLTISEMRFSLAQKYHFLRYAALSWASHMSHMLDAAKKEANCISAALFSSPRSVGPSSRMNASSLPRKRLCQEHKRNEYYDEALSESDKINEPSDMEWSGEEFILRSRFNKKRTRESRISRQQVQSTKSIDYEDNTEGNWNVLFSVFHLHRYCVTAWVEACWTFAQPGKLQYLSKLLHDLTVEVSTKSIEGRELCWIMHGTTQLMYALEDLRVNHGRALSVTPSLIWGPSIRSFEDPAFWPDWQPTVKDKEVDEQSSIMVKSGFNPQLGIPTA